MQKRQMKKHLVKKGYREEYEDLVVVSKVRVGAKVKMVFDATKERPVANGAQELSTFFSARRKFCAVLR
jgi:hypothetical protein